MYLDELDIDWLNQPFVESRVLFPPKAGVNVLELAEDFAVAASSGDIAFSERDEVLLGIYTKCNKLFDRLINCDRGA